MGEDLISQIAIATGLPPELVQGELARLLEAAGLHPNAATLEDVRAVLAEYVQDVLVDAKDRLSAAS
jgi:hypothetical protein